MTPKSTALAPLHRAPAPRYPAWRALRRATAGAAMAFLVGACGGAAEEGPPPSTPAVVATAEPSSTPPRDGPPEESPSAEAAGHRGPRDMVDSREIRLSGVVASPSRRHVVEALRARLDGVVACYEAQLEVTPSVEGRLVVELTCEGGRCSRVTIVEDGLGSAPVAVCVTATLDGLAIPDVGHDGALTIRYPYVFRRVPEEEPGTHPAP